MSSLAGQLEPAPRRSRDGNAEARIQAAIVDWCRTVAPECLVFAVPNGGLRDKREAARLRWQGVTPGIPDLIVFAPVGRVLCLEVKAPAGNLSAEQRNVFDRLVALGIRCGVVRSIDDARRAFQACGIKTREAA